MESNVANNTPNGNGAFPRIVIYSTVAPTRPSARAAFHRESPIAGYPDCGTTLIRPHRAISVDDTRLCGHCWGDIAGVTS